MLDLFGVRPGATVLELGPGNGYFSIDAGRLLGRGGRLICLDIQPPMLTDLRGRLAAAGVTNAHPVLGDAHHLPLADDSVDAAFLVTVLGEIPDRQQGLAELRRVLKPGGLLLVAVKAGAAEGYQPELLGIETPIWFTLFTEEEIADYYRQAGLQIEFIEKRDPYGFEIKVERIFAIGEKR